MIVLMIVAITRANERPKPEEPKPTDTDAEDVLQDPVTNQQPTPTPPILPNGKKSEEKHQDNTVAWVVITLALVGVFLVWVLSSLNDWARCFEEGGNLC